MNIVFSYSLLNAQYIPISSITIYDTDTENIVCKYFNFYNDLYKKHITPEIKYTVSMKVVNEIYNIIDKSPEILKYTDIESHFILDGVINKFIFSDKSNKNEISAYNIWAFEKQESVLYSKAIKAKTILNVFNKIAKILIQNGVSESYLKLE